MLVSPNEIGVFSLKTGFAYMMKIGFAYMMTHALGYVNHCYIFNVQLL